MKSDPHATAKLVGMSNDVKHSAEMNKLFAARQRSDSAALSSSSSISSLRRRRQNGGKGAHTEPSKSISRMSYKGGGSGGGGGREPSGMQRSVSRLDDAPHRLLHQYSPRSTIAAPGLMPCFSGTVTSI